MKEKYKKSKIANRPLYYEREKPSRHKNKCIANKDVTVAQEKGLQLLNSLDIGRRKRASKRIKYILEQASHNTIERKKREEVCAQVLMCLRVCEVC